MKEMVGLPVKTSLIPDGVSLDTAVFVSSRPLLPFNPPA